MNLLDDLLRQAYDAGWHDCARMAQRDDLHCDIDSPFVEGKREATLRRLVAAGHVGAQSAQVVDEE